jgi:hypothetical protein
LKRPSPRRPSQSEAETARHRTAGPPGWKLSEINLEIIALQLENNPETTWKWLGNNLKTNYTHVKKLHLAILYIGILMPAVWVWHEAATKEA